MTTLASIVDLAPEATGFLETYCSPSGLYAWPAYDTDANPAELTPVDVLGARILELPDQKHLREPDVSTQR